MEDVALTVDVEKLYPDSEKGAYDFIELFAKHNIKGTFFVTREVLIESPDIVKAIIAEGHEIASHGYHHPGRRDSAGLRYLNEMSEAEAEEEIRRSKEVFDTAGIEVKGFRAPAFKITRENLKQISSLFYYDSSVSNFILKTKKYSNIAREPCILDGIVEIPVSTFPKVPIMLGSPTFSSIGAKSWIWFIKMLGLTNPSVFYFHSFDTVPFSGDSLAVPNWWFKRLYYYRGCGKTRISFLDTLFSYLRDRGCNFLKCLDIANSFRNSLVDDDREGADFRKDQALP